MAAETPLRQNGRDAEDSIPASEVKEDACLSEKPKGYSEKEKLRKKYGGERVADGEGKKEGWMCRAEARIGQKSGLGRKMVRIGLFLLLLLILLLLAVVAMAACWPKTPHRLLFPTCQTPACLMASARMVPRMNMSRKPCDDFLNFACGHWLAERHFPLTRSRWNQREELEYKVRERIRSMIATMPHPTRVKASWKVKYFYDSCMSLDNVETDKERQLIRIINQLGNWRVLRGFSVHEWDFKRTWERLSTEFGVTPFLKVEVVSDPRGAEHNIIQISPAGLGLPDRSYYYRQPNSDVVIAYKQFLKDVSQQLGATTNDASTFSDDVFHFEKRIAEITPSTPLSPSDAPLSGENQKIKTLGEIWRIAPSIPLMEILQAMFPNANIQDSTEILVPSTYYLSRISTIISSIDRSALNNYMMWNFVSAHLIYLSKEYRNIVHTFRRATEGVPEPYERWEFCVSVLQRYMPYAVMALHQNTVKKEMEDNRKVVEEIFHSIRNAALRKVAESTFDRSLKSKLLDKVGNMTIQVGYPDSALEESFVEEKHNKMFVQKNDFFQNILYGIAFRREVMEQQLLSTSSGYKGRSIPQEGFSNWDEEGFSSRAMYEGGANRVFVPHQILIPPFFDPGYPRAFLYGTIGVEIAEAVTEGLLAEDLSFDVNKLHEPVEVHSSVTTSFTEPLPPFAEETAKCIKKTVVEKDLATMDVANRTVLDTFVQVNAVRLASQALAHVSVDSPHIHQPALEDFESEQIFFLSYGQKICTLMTPQELDALDTIGKSLRDSVLLKLVLLQDNMFSEAFKCPGSSTVCR